MGNDFNHRLARDAVLKLAKLYDLKVEDEGSSYEAEETGSAMPVTLSDRWLVTAKAWVRAGKLRGEFLDASLFADPAWNILLDLYVNRLEARQVSVSSACTAANVPQTSALRWINVLCNAGLITKIDDPADKRRTFVHLEDQITEKMNQLMDATIASDRRLGLERVRFTK